MQSGNRTAAIILDTVIPDIASRTSRKTCCILTVADGPSRLPAFLFAVPNSSLRDESFDLELPTDDLNSMTQKGFFYTCHPHRGKIYKVGDANIRRHETK